MRTARTLRATLALVGTAAATLVAIVAASPQPALALDNGLARTPPMGFNNWNSTGCRAEFNESMVLGIMDIFVNQGLRDAGYKYVNLDDCWAVPAPNSRDANGVLIPDPTRFPHGIKYLADYAHARGLKLGVYTSAGTKTCNTLGFSGGLGHETTDAATFASWGVDYLKYDNCNNQNVDAQQRYTTMRDALAATGRPIVYSICEWGRTDPKVWTWGGPVGNLWRTTGDISDSWTSMIGKAQIDRDLAQYAGPGHWNDPDMLEVGNGGMTATEYRSHFSLWAMMAAPLLIGSDLRTASADTLTILKNADVIAVDQDPLGRQGTVLSNDGAGHVAYVKTLANGDRAVALSNETTTSATISTTAAAAGIGGSASYTLKDLWSKAVTTSSGAISASVGGHATVVYRVSRAGTTTRFEAEQAATSTGSTVDANWSGFSGTGFVNTANAAGSYVEFAVTAAAAGQARLTLDYGNGGTADRPSTLTVNGSGATTLAFPPTGAWSLWKTQVATVNLVAGTNLIRLTATGAGGVANLDYLDVTTATTPVANYEAEDATIVQGVVESNHTGFFGTGFVNGDNLAGPYVQWSVSSASTAATTITIRYANGTAATRTADVSVNGVTLPGLSFPTTGNWDTWATVSFTATLTTGSNLIRVTATGADGNPNFDRLSVG
ncbi:carbohydrate-binding protein [Hamadaea tsunoensis]|uniref:carbohydrate-binding protein n=1 Tax=Hamadaea tsunoensis TaxID=53368 RepID=UPI0004248DEE|nr:CBM35 domain-containing protein [Hamadaea tsunoensis]